MVAVLVEPNIGLIARVEWNNSVLVRANLQAIISLSGPLHAAIGDASANLHYLRLDHHPQELGSLLQEPGFHVHYGKDNHPRFEAGNIGDGNIVMAFLDLLYRNYVYDKWLVWAELAWKKSAGSKELRQNVFQTLCTHFAQGNSNVLVGQHQRDIQILKRRLRRALSLAFPLRAEPIFKHIFSIY